MKTWILVANASDAKLFQTEDLRKGHLTLVKEFIHNESREKNTELVADGPGYIQTDRQGRNAYEKKEDPKQVEADNFAHELVKVIKHGHATQEFLKLIICSSPHFYGLLHKHLNMDDKNFTHIPKDYTKLAPKELIEQLRKHIFQ
jgi:protein required for attachment to host cells